MKEKHKKVKSQCFWQSPFEAVIKQENREVQVGKKDLIRRKNQPETTGNMLS